MATVAIRRSGGASIVSIPKSVLGSMGLDVGSELELTVENRTIVMKPRAKELTLDDILVGCTPELLAMTEEEREWHDMPPAGEEEN